MPTPEAVNRIAQCAPGKRVTVILPIEAKAPEVPEASMAEVCFAILKRDQIRDRESIEQLAQAVGNMGEMVASLKGTMESMVQTQKAVAVLVAKVADTLGQPMKPVYDARGMLVGARRVEKL